MLYKTRDFVNKDILKSMYFALFDSILTMPLKFGDKILIT